MRIGISFFGISYGPGKGSDRDFRHCWPNIKKMLIDPFKDRGHDIKIFISTYRFEDKEIEKEFYDIIKPDRVYFSEFKGSNAFTSKYASFKNFEEDEELDVIIFSRIDVHYRKIIANENINLNKFNFLFPEYGNWKNNRYTTDNIYIWPHHMTPMIKPCMEKASLARGGPWVDTHSLYTFLIQKIKESEIHMISDMEEWSDTNTYYTVCRGKIWSRDCGLHPEVEECYKTKGWQYSGVWREGASR